MKTPITIGAVSLLALGAGCGGAGISSELHDARAAIA